MTALLATLSLLALGALAWVVTGRAGPGPSESPYGLWGRG